MYDYKSAVIAITMLRSVHWVLLARLLTVFSPLGTTSKVTDSIQSTGYY
jgi:hypothetical protein